MFPLTRATHLGIPVFLATARCAQSRDALGLLKEPVLAKQATQTASLPIRFVKVGG